MSQSSNTPSFHPLSTTLYATAQFCNQTTSYPITNTPQGAALYDLLAAEVELREERTNAVARPLEIEAIESGVRLSKGAVGKQLLHVQTMLDNLASDERGLSEKVGKG